jgi:hypothetical protein
MLKSGLRVKIVGKLFGRIREFCLSLQPNSKKTITKQSLMQLKRKANNSKMSRRMTPLEI